jgi:hypothetical protein
MIANMAPFATCTDVFTTMPFPPFPPCPIAPAAAIVSNPSSVTLKICTPLGMTNPLTVVAPDDMVIVPKEGPDVYGTEPSGPAYELPDRLSSKNVDVAFIVPNQPPVQRHCVGLVALYVVVFLFCGQLIQPVELVLGIYVPMAHVSQAVVSIPV